jgi:hypothetical protein
MTEEIEVKAEDVVLAEDGSIIDKAPLKEEPAAEAPQEEERSAKVEEDHPDDEQGEDGESEEEAEARRERNRIRRRENKDRRKEYVESLKRELAARDELLARQEERLAAIERRTHGADIAAVDAELKKSVDAYNFFKNQLAEATNQSNGQLAVEAQERMMQAADRAKQLASIKEASKRQQATPAPAPLDPRIKAQAEGWLERNTWYDPDTKDADSKIAKTIDETLHQEGWNPTTEQYWEELDARLKKYLPHRYNSGYNKSQGTGGSKPRAPVAGSGRETANPSSGGYRLSAARVQALRDSGLWDDPAQRAKAIKNFQQYDKGAQ